MGNQENNFKKKEKIKQKIKEYAIFLSNKNNNL